jgi:hypothetical protein
VDKFAAWLRPAVRACLLGSEQRRRTQGTQMKDVRRVASSDSSTGARAGAREERGGPAMMMSGKLEVKCEVKKVARETLQPVRACEKQSKQQVRATEKETTIQRMLKVVEEEKKKQSPRSLLIVAAEGPCAIVTTTAQTRC